MTVDEMRSVFTRWDAASLCTANINFKEVFDPPVDPYADYLVIYEASFESTSLDKARIEFWLTDAGYAAVGIEKYARVKKRSGLKTWREGFAAGHEPKAASRDGLQILFDVVTAGKFRLVAGNVFGTMASPVRAEMYASDIEAMEQSGYLPPCRAIPDGMPLSSPRRWKRVFEYSPW